MVCYRVGDKARELNLEGVERESEDCLPACFTAAVNSRTKLCFGSSIRQFPILLLCIQLCTSELESCNLPKQDHLFCFGELRLWVFHCLFCFVLLEHGINPLDGAMNLEF